MKDVVDAGTFVYYDEDSDLVLTHEDDEGTAYPHFATATSIKLVCQPLDGAGATVEVSGAVYDASLGQLRFLKVAQALADPGARRSLTYRCHTRWTKSGASNPSFSRTEWRLTVERFPL